VASKTTGLASISEGRSDIHRVDPRKLYIQPNWNGRDFNDPSNLEHVNMLAQSIAEIGVKEPLTVYWAESKAWLVDGECRLRATLRAIDVYKADIKTIPIKTEDRTANDADRLFSQIIRNSGKQFSQMEQAKVYKRLVDMGWQQGEIAKKAGISPARISQILDLLSMPEPIKQMVTKGEVSASLAVATLKEHNGAKAVQLLQDAVATAKDEGKERALPKHVEQSAPATEAKPPAGKRSLALQTIVTEAFEYSDVDDEGEIVIIKMPSEQWEALRKAAKL
jgi:ParB family chromosome partitioning protein